ncbi:MAG: thioesterase family protein [Limibacillus sp.]
MSERPSPDAFPSRTHDKLRYNDTDRQGHVNNAVYLQWFESVRVRYAQMYGVLPSPDNGSGPRIVIRSATIHYRQEMLLDEDYVVTCGCTAFRTTSFTCHQELWSGGALRASLDCVLVLLRPDGSGRYPIPEAVRTRFAELDGAIDDR